jgi:hypothetical protein
MTPTTTKVIEMFFSPPSAEPYRVSIGAASSIRRAAHWQRLLHSPSDTQGPPLPSAGRGLMSMQGPPEGRRARRD